MANERGGETTLASDSLEELRYIFGWSLAHRNYREGDIILIGGWAVHSFNPWKYSLDIDLITPGRFKATLKNHLSSSRGYSRERDSAGNTLLLKRLDSGDIYLDFLPKRDRFHGTNTTLNLMRLEYRTATQNISYSFNSGFQVIVPEISMLLLLKLKAAWDRYTDLSSGFSPDPDHLEEKFTKDCGDVLALLQSKSFQFARFDWLSSTMSKFDFLKKFLGQGILENNSTFDRISRKEGEELIQRLLSLI
ncbi:MAG: hypothetical protein ACYDAZ_01525 [Thermoplasmataceae archaeon]